MLVVRSEHSRRHYRAEGIFVLDIDGGGDRGQDTCGLNLEADRGVLTKVEGKNIFVVADRDNRLQHEDT